MKTLYKSIIFLIFSLLTACIEEYDVVMEDPENEILVVEGNIVGGTECEFILQRSTCKQESGAMPDLVGFATVYVICSDGQVFGAKMRDDYHYYVNLSELDPNETYHLQMHIPGEGLYESEPMYPTPGSRLSKLSYTLSDAGETVQIRLTNEDPHGEMYYLWTYDEHWEINTPLITDWRYDRSRNSIYRLEQKINRGWCAITNHPAVLGSNHDYGNGAIKDYVLYTLSNMDKRFNTRYHTKVHQMAISKTEYEYYKQLEAQTTQTGGLFTLMPSQLPTNIHSERGLKVQGFVGVHHSTSDAEIYINRGDVGYKLLREIEILTDSIVKNDFSWLGEVYDMGYRLYRYNGVLGMTEWTKPWCIDCRDDYWGASLERPDFWQDN